MLAGLPMVLARAAEHLAGNGGIVHHPIYLIYPKNYSMIGRV